MADLVSSFRRFDGLYLALSKFMRLSFLQTSLSGPICFPRQNVLLTLDGPDPWLNPYALRDSSLHLHLPIFFYPDFTIF